MRRLFYDILTAHIHSERLGDAHGAVLIEIVLKEGYEHSRRSNDGVIKSVCTIASIVRPVKEELLELLLKGER